MRVLLVLVVMFLSSHGWALYEIEEEIESLSCGERVGNVKFRTRYSKELVKPDKFAILIDGSPVDGYFSDSGPNFNKITKGLLDRGYKVLEIAYRGFALVPGPSRGIIPVEGIYRLCLHQGVNALGVHSAQVYDRAQAILGFDSEKDEVIGFGFSMGANLLHMMAFSHGRSFKRMGETGVLMGDLRHGCQIGLEHGDWDARLKKGEITEAQYLENDRIFSGWSWGPFMKWVGLINRDEGSKCGEVGSWNFESLPYRDKGKLGLFEGARVKPVLGTKFTPGTPGQARYIKDIRDALGAHTVLKLYDSGGHDLSGEKDPTFVQDVLEFLANEG